MCIIAKTLRKKSSGDPILCIGELPHLHPSDMTIENVINYYDDLDVD